MGQIAAKGGEHHHTPPPPLSPSVTGDEDDNEDDLPPTPTTSAAVAAADAAGALGGNSSSLLGLLALRGQDPSGSGPLPAGQWQNELVRQTRTIQRVAGITYEEFLFNIKQLNDISSHYLDSNGKQLVFAVKKGSDRSIFWKATVSIACVKVDAYTKEIDSFRSLNLKQFLQIFHRLKNQSDAVGGALGVADDCCGGSDQISSSSAAAAAVADIADIAVATPPEECIVCLERSIDLTLPCCHSYCLPCIEQWNVDHKTCPVCRETLSTTDDGWVISEGPDCDEITTEIQKSLLSLTQ